MPLPFSFYGPFLGFPRDEDEDLLRPTLPAPPPAQRPGSRLPSFGFDDIPVEARKQALGQALFSLGTNLMAGAGTEGFAAVPGALQAGHAAYGSQMALAHELGERKRHEERQTRAEQRDIEEGKQRAEAGRAAIEERRAEAAARQADIDRQQAALSLIEDEDDRARMAAQVGQSGFWTAYNKSFEKKGEKAPTVDTFYDGSTAVQKAWMGEERGWVEVGRGPRSTARAKTPAPSYAGLTPAQVESWISSQADADFNAWKTQVDLTNMAPSERLNIDLPAKREQFAAARRQEAEQRFGYKTSPSAAVVAGAGTAAGPSAAVRPTTATGERRVERPGKPSDDELLNAIRDDVATGQVTPEAAFAQIEAVWGQAEAIRLLNLAIQRGLLVPK